MPDGPQRIIDTAQTMGIPGVEPDPEIGGFPATTPGLEPNTGVALGSQTVSPINMANGYATIANAGRRPSRSSSPRSRTPTATCSTSTRSRTARR